MSGFASRHGLRFTFGVVLVALALLGGVWAVYATLRGNANEQAAKAAEATADALLTQQDFNGAVTALSEVARRRPRDSEALEKLSKAVYRANDKPGLVRAAQTELARDPNDVVALTIAASALLGKDDARNQLDYLRRLVALLPRNSLFRITLAQELVAYHFYDEARPHLAQLLRDVPDDPAPHYLSGQADFYEAVTPEAFAKAAVHFERALELQPRLSRAHLFLGRIALRQNRPQDALAQLTQAADAMPRNTDVLFELARAYGALGDNAQQERTTALFGVLKRIETEAARLIKKCNVSPDDFDLHLKTAEALMQGSSPQKAIYYVNRALTIRPNDPKGEAAVQKLDAILNAGGPQ